MRIKISTSINNSAGQSAITAVFFLVAISLVIGAGFTSLGLKQINSSRIFLRSLQSYAASESGVEDVMLRISRKLPVDTNEILSIGGGNVTTATVNIGTDKEIIGSAAVNNFVRRAKVVMSEGAGAEYTFGIQVGEGGFCMDEGAQVIGNAYSSGNILGPSAGGCDRNPGGQGQKGIITGNASAGVGYSDNPNDSESNYEQNLAFGKTSPVIDIAQKFRFSTAGPAGRLWLFLRKVGNPPPLNVRIVRNSGGVPSNNLNDIMASSTIPASAVISNYLFVDIIFATSTLLSVNTDYWFILDASQNSNNYYEVGQDSGSSSDQKATADSSSPSAVWSNISGGDINFKIWQGAVTHKISDINISGIGWAHTIDDSIIGGDALAFSLSNSTVSGSVSADSISNCTINGDASYNSKVGCSVLGNQSTPNTAPPDPVFLPLPINAQQIQAWHDAAAAGGTYSGSCPYRPADGATIGPKLIPCDLEILNNRKIKLGGTVWVTGNIFLDNGSVLQLAPSYGSLSGALIGEHPLGETDHTHIVIYPGVVICGSEGYNTSTHSCNTPNGSYIHFLYINEPLMTSIHIENNVDGRAVFYDPHGRIKIQNGAHVRSAVVSYEFHMYQNTFLEFAEDLQAVGFTEGPLGAFLIKNWREVE